MRSWLTRHTARRRHRARLAARAGVSEGLESRVMLTTFTVTSTKDAVDSSNDATEFTLREAILAANANPGADTIEFNIAGGGVGYYMDVQEAKLRQRLRNSGVSVTRIGDQIQLIMPGNVTFATGSPDINAGFYEVLNSVAIVLKEYEKTTVDVIGHTDSVGAEEYNQRLSEARARSVADYLSSQGTLPARGWTVIVLGTIPPKRPRSINPAISRA